MNKFLNPINYWLKFIFYKDRIIYATRYNVEKIREVERNRFKEYGFDYDEALKKINHILAELNQSNFETQQKQGMASAHWLLFCGISEVSSIRNILEIGTFNGQTTRILSKIFSNAHITTIDLPENDPIFTNSYKRDNAEYKKQFLIEQQQNTADKNINIIKKNSFFLPEIVDEKFDLIWVDGGHLYPEISWDICNAYHLCNEHGWIMYDDIISNKNYRPKGASPDSYHILEYLKQRTNYKITYFLKRDNPDFSANPNKRKFVALMNKKN